MKLRTDEDSWICSRMEKTMLHKNMEIRANWESVVNEGKEYWIRGQNRLDARGRVGRNVLQVPYTLFSKTDRTKTR